MGGVVDSIGDAVGGIFGGGDVEVNVPEPGAEETQLFSDQSALIQQQIEIANKQNQLTQSLLPISLSAAGLTPTYDAQGNITGATETPLSPEEQERNALRDEIELGFLQRTDAALKGELPENPALISDLRDQEEKLNEQLRKQLGPGYETSSAGIETLAQFDEDRINLLESARRGDLTLAEQLGIARQTANIGADQVDLSNLLGFTNFNAGNQAIAGSAASSGNQLLGNFINSRNLGAQGSIAQAGFDAQSAAGFGNLLGVVGTAPTSSGGSIFGDIFRAAIPAATTAAVAASDRRLKKDIELVGETPGGFNVYSFEYLWGEKAIGVMADEVEKVLPDAVVMDESGYQMVDYSRIT